MLNTNKMDWHSLEKIIGSKEAEDIVLSMLRGEMVSPIFDLCLFDWIYWPK